jgi:hypothetical protein
MPNENLPNQSDSPKSTAAETTDGLNRREVAKRAGKFLAYTAPALIALVTAKDAGAYAP